jgi:hypothetical protein
METSIPWGHSSWKVATWEEQASLSVSISVVIILILWKSV